MKVICPVCEKVVGAYVPKGGDGSAYRPRRHGNCEGRFELVEEIFEGAPNKVLQPTAGTRPRKTLLQERLEKLLEEDARSGG